MALLTLQRSSVTGTVITTATPSASDTFAPHDHGVLDVFNGGGVETTLTVTVPGNDKYGQPRGDVAVAVAVGVRRRIGFGPNGFGFPVDLADPITGLVTIGTTPTASVTIAYTD